MSTESTVESADPSAVEKLKDSAERVRSELAIGIILRGRDGARFPLLSRGLKPHG